jgi:hypothetical protein
MEEAPENGKETSHSAQANGLNEWMNEWVYCRTWLKSKINLMCVSFGSKINITFK